MTLNRQLWLAIVLLMAMTFIGSFVVSSLSAKDYLQQQLHLKNIDNANSLALSLSGGDGDLVTVELMINAQYDSGHYQFIRFDDAAGKPVMERRDNASSRSFPQWLTTVFPIEPEPGIAHVSAGWTQLGTVTLQSDSRFAYQALWKETQRLGGYFFVAALVAGLLGSLLLRSITQPLRHVVEQAKAMEQRRFITLSTIPKTLEFKALTGAMNHLSSRIKQMLADESGRLALLRQSLERDEVTGLLNREPFLEQLNSYLHREDGSSSGVVAIVRLLHLTELNRQYGREVMDQLLGQFGEQLMTLSGPDKPYITGRLNGSDFVLLAPREFDAEKLARQARELLLACTHESNVDDSVVPAAASQYHTEDCVGGLLSRIDAALINAEAYVEGGVEVVSSSSAIDASNTHQLNSWQQIIDEAINKRQLKLVSYPVVDGENNLLHCESPSRLLIKGQQALTAAQFMPWVSRLNRGVDFDCLITELAIEKIAKEGLPVSISLLARTLADNDGVRRLIDIVSRQPEHANKLWVEVSEAGVYQYLEGYRVLCEALKPLGCKFGIEHVGHEVAHIGELHDFGLDYLKLDASLCSTVYNNQGNQVFIRGLCTIAHSIGLLAIAEGVSDQQAWDCLVGLGIDGGTGVLFQTITDLPDTSE